jgi:hypothetical protein
MVGVDDCSVVMKKVVSTWDGLGRSGVALVGTLRVSVDQLMVLRVVGGGVIAMITSDNSQVAKFLGLLREFFWGEKQLGF